MKLSKEEKEKRSEERKLKKYNKIHKEVDGIIYKQCNRHKEFFPEEDDWLPMTEDYYYINKMNSIDGFNTYCISCTKKKSKKWQKENPDKYKKIKDRQNKQPKIKEMQRIANINYRKSGKYRKYQENHREQVREYSRKRQQNKEHKINKKEWKDCLTYFNNECAYCGMTLEEHKELYSQQLHKDHVIYNGANDLSNCIPACKSCNGSKGEYNMEGWYSKQKFYNEDKIIKIYQWLSADYKLYIEEHKAKGKYIKKNKDYWENKSKVN